MEENGGEGRKGGGGAWPTAVTAEAPNSSNVKSDKHVSNDGPVLKKFGPAAQRLSHQATRSTRPISKCTCLSRGSNYCTVTLYP